MRPRTLLVALLVGLAAAALALVTAEGAREQAFQAPGLLDVVREDDEGFARDLSHVHGRILSKAELSLVFRWLTDPVELEVREPAGALDLRLGDSAGASATLVVKPDALGLRVHAGEAAPAGWTIARPDGDRFALVHDGTAWRARVDGEDAGPAVRGLPPAGPASIEAHRHASFAGARVATADGVERELATPRGAGPAGRVLWAVLGAWLACLAVPAWWRMRGGGDPRPRRRDGVLAIVVVVALVAGLATTLRERNAGRLLEAPAAGARHAHARPEAVTVEPGRPYDLRGRVDSDFELGARVTLAPGSALDVLVRAESAQRDRGLLVTLSADPELSVGITRHLGTRMPSVAADDARRTLEPDVAHDVLVRCVDADTTLVVDGDPIVVATDHDLRVGRTAFLALSGRAVVEDVSIRPLAEPRALAGTLLAWQALAALGVVLPLLVAWRVSGRRAAAALWAWPLAVAVQPVAPAGAFAGGAVLAGAFLLLSPSRSARGVLVVLLGGVALASAVVADGRRPVVLTPALLNELLPSDVRGEAVPRAYAWARHPLVRRFNRYVRNQRFREETVSLTPTPGVPRVFAVGSSSTFGYGVPAEDAWPARLEDRLREGGVEVDVLNAGVPGSTAARLALTVEGLLLRFSPDVIVVSLSFNDHIQGAIFDEVAHYDAMTSTGIGVLGHLAQQVDAWRRSRDWGRYFAARIAGEEPPPELVEEYVRAPARRFAGQLRRIVDAARAAGAAVVLVQEPFDPREETTRVMIAPFHEAVAQVAAETGATLVDPGPALRPGGKGLFLDAVHLAGAGHDRMSVVLAKALDDAGLVRR